MDCKEIQPVHPKGDQSWVFIGRTDVEAETPILWPPDVKSWLIWKDPDAGKDWGQEEKGTTEDEMARWHHQLNGPELGWTLGVGDGQGGLACCGPWGCKELNTTERLNWIHWILNGKNNNNNKSPAKQGCGWNSRIWEKAAELGQKAKILRWGWGMQTQQTVSDKTQHKAKDTGTDRVPVTAVSASSTHISPLVSLHHGAGAQNLHSACLATVASTNESAHRRLRRRKRGRKTSLCLLGLMKTSCI